MWTLVLTGPFINFIIHNPFSLVIFTRYIKCIPQVIISTLFFSLSNWFLEAKSKYLNYDYNWAVAHHQSLSKARATRNIGISSLLYGGTSKLKKKKKVYFAKPSGVAGNPSHLSFISSLLGETAGISLSFLPFPLFLFLHFLA